MRDFKRGDRVVYRNFFGDKVVETEWHGTVVGLGLDRTVYVFWDDDEYTPMTKQDPRYLKLLEQETLDRELESALNQVTSAFSHLAELGYYVWWDELSFFVGVRDGDDAFYVNRDTQYNWDWEQR